MPVLSSSWDAPWLAPAATVVPYTYTSLLWAILLGWLIFADAPTPLMLLGAAIIVASGLFVLHREARRAK